MPLKTKKYDKKLDFSYTFGAFPTIDLLKTKPKEVVKVIINPKGENSEGVKEVKQLCQKFNIRTEWGSKSIARISVKENTYVVGVFNKYKSEVEKNKNHVVLVNPSDFGNVGTIMRSMLGFGLRNLVIIRPAVDIFNPAVVRSAMGALFRLNFEYFESFEQYVKAYPENNIYPFMLHNAKSINLVSFQEPYSLVFGKEGSGLDRNFSKYGTSVYIPHNQEIDSLNLSVAASIAFYQVSKK